MQNHLPKIVYSTRFFAGLTACSLMGMAAILSSYANPLMMPAKPASAVKGVVNGKEGYKLRFSKTTNGALTFAGNTLCLAESVSHGSCGTYITTDQSSQDTTFNPKTSGTTTDWKKNSSTTKLTIPDGAEILYAELIWGGNYKYLNQDITKDLYTSVVLVGPNQTTFTIKPVSETAAEVSDSSSYVRTSGDIKEIIKKAGSGTYTVGAVPSIMAKNNPYNNYVGYTLVVAYAHKDEPPRNMTIFVGAEQVGPDQFTNTAEVKGFATPGSGPVSGKLFVSAQEGDPMYSGDQMRFGTDKKDLKTLQGANNKKDNFFASQINDNNSNLDPRGSFGESNQSLGNNKPGARQGWDVTGVDISSQLKNNQNTAYAQGTSTGDSYLINALGIQIEVNAAKPKIDLTLEKQVGNCDPKVFTLKSVFKNEGSANSEKTIMKDYIPQGAKLVAGSLMINGSGYTGQNPENGVDLGTVKPGQTVAVTYKVAFDQLNFETFVAKNKFAYEYEMIAGSSKITNEIISKEIEVTKEMACENNRAPIAEDDAATTQKSQPITVDVLKNDSDPDNNLKPDTLQITKQPEHGTASVVNGQIQYTPNPDFSGQDTLEYQVCDTKGLCDTAKVTINVPSIQASDDQATTIKDTPVAINILDNDSGVLGKPDPKKITITTQPSNGTVAIDDKGVATFTPKAGWTGEDQFEYKVCLDTYSDVCDTAIVKVTIPEEIVVPVAQDDSAVTLVNTPVKIGIVENDSDPKDSLDISTVTITKQPEHGTIEADLETGEINYSPNPDYKGNDELEYQICNTFGKCDTAKVTVLIEAPAQSSSSQQSQNSSTNSSEQSSTSSQTSSEEIGRPDAKDDAANTKINTPVEIDLPNNDTDSKNSLDKTTVAVISEPKNGTVAIDPVTGVATYTPKKDFQGIDEFTYEICNTFGKCDTAKAVVKIGENPVSSSSKSGQVLGEQESSQSDPANQSSQQSSQKGQVLGAMEDLNLVRSGGVALWGFVALFFSFLVGIGGWFVSMKSKFQKSEVAAAQDFDEYTKR